MRRAKGAGSGRVLAKRNVTRQGNIDDDHALIAWIALLQRDRRAVSNDLLGRGGTTIGCLATVGDYLAAQREALLQGLAICYSNGRRGPMNLEPRLLQSFTASFWTERLCPETLS